MNINNFEITIKNAKYILTSSEYTDSEKLDLLDTVIEKLEGDILNVPTT